MRHWRIFYIDGEVESFSAADGPPEAAPPWGVGLIAQEHPDSGHERVAFHDYYYWCSELGLWMGSDLVGMVDQFTRYPSSRHALKVGRTTSNARWREHVEEAIRFDKALPDQTRPPKTANQVPSAARGQWTGYSGE